MKDEGWREKIRDGMEKRKGWMKEEGGGKNKIGWSGEKEGGGWTKERGGMEKEGLGGGLEYKRRKKIKDILGTREKYELKRAFFI